MFKPWSPTVQKVLAFIGVGIALAVWGGMIFALVQDKWEVVLR